MPPLRALSIAPGTRRSTQLRTKVSGLTRKTERAARSPAQEASRRSPSTSGPRRTETCGWSLVFAVLEEPTRDWRVESPGLMTGGWDDRKFSFCWTKVQYTGCHRFDKKLVKEK